MKLFEIKLSDFAVSKITQDQIDKHGVDDPIYINLNQSDDKKQIEFLFEVPSASEKDHVKVDLKGNKKGANNGYAVIVRFENSAPITSANLGTVIKTCPKCLVHCDCPAFYYQGMQQDNSLNGNTKYKFQGTPGGHKWTMKHAAAGGKTGQAMCKHLKVVQDFILGRTAILINRLKDKEIQRPLDPINTNDEEVKENIMIRNKNTLLEARKARARRIAEARKVIRTRRNNLNENNVNGDLPVSVDSFLQDISQFYDFFDYSAIMRVPATAISPLRKLARKFKALAEVDDEEGMEEVALQAANLISPTNPMGEKRIRSSRRIVREGAFSEMDIDNQEDAVEKFCMLMDWEIEPEEITAVDTLNDDLYRITVGNHFYVYDVVRDCITDEGDALMRESRRTRRIR